MENSDSLKGELLTVPEIASSFIVIEGPVSWIYDRVRRTGLFGTELS